MTRLCPCAWCEKPFAPKEQAIYCSKACWRAHMQNGWGMNKRQLEEMRSRPPGPPNCATVEEWLAKGGVPYRIEEKPLPELGVPVFSRGREYLGGRVR